MFKKYKSETSISEYLNNKLKGLLWNLEDIEKGIKEALKMAAFIRQVNEGDRVTT